MALMKTNLYNQSIKLQQMRIKGEYVLNSQKLVNKLK
jgi:hypothetical protein